MLVGIIRDWWYGHTRENETPPPSDPSTATKIPSREPAARAVSPREAVGLSAVFRAVELRAVAMKQISYDVKKAGQIREDKPLLLGKPDPDTSYGRFMKMTSASLDLAGNAYWRIGRTPDGQASTAWVMNPHDVRIKTSISGRVTGYEYRDEVLSVDEVKHLARLIIPGSPYGFGPIQLAQLELRGIIDTTEYASDFVYSGDTPTGVLKSDSPLTKDTADQARKQWEESRGGRRSVAILGQGLNYQSVYLSARDAQFIESQQFNVTAIARMFGVPASLMLLVMEGSSQTYQNVDQEWNGFVKFGLMDVLDEVEDTFTDLLPRGSRAVKNTAALLEGDTKTRYETHNLALTGGWRTVNEIRAIEGLKPLDGGDTITAPVATKEEPADV